MVQEEEESSRSSRLGRFKGLIEGGKLARRLANETNGAMSPSTVVPSSNDEQPSPSTQTKLAAALSRTENVKSRMSSEGAQPSPVAKKAKPTEMDLMKEKFAKLLLGEDMSGRGKGVSSALALSNAITNLAASAYGEMKRLEPMASDTRERWKREIEWLMSVTDHIVEFVAIKQKAKDGSMMEVMGTRQRTDPHMNIPALRKLDTMLLECLDNFKGSHEFYHGSKDDDSQKGQAQRSDDKWWIPVPKVPTNGLSETTRKWLQYQKDSVNQVLKAAMAINAQVLSEMDIPESYIEALPKNGRASLGDTIYKIITDDFFDPDHLLSSVDLSSEHKIVDFKNKIEASVVIWKRKMTAKDSKSSWGSAVSMEKREQLEDRAETVPLILKHHFPGLPQSDLDISKIEYNKDVGHVVLESYSRILETLAFTVLSRIEDVMNADAVARNQAYIVQKKCSIKEGTGSEKLTSAEMENLSSNEIQTPTSKTLLDFMGWNLDQGDNDANKDSNDPGKPENIATTKKLSYIERLEIQGGSKSPTARH